LATKIGRDPDALEQTVVRYNEFCALGKDLDFGRSPEYLLAIETPPYYAMELSPTFTNTQGGPRRNLHAQILDIRGNPIPRLYSSGELGSIYSNAYNGGMNLGECMAFGRIAAEHVTGLDPWS
jgi:predicted oxidoreductase